MKGINFNGKHTYRNFDLILLDSREIETPSKIKVKESVPFMSGSYDFSNLYGGNCFTERKLQYEFLVKATTRQQLELKRMNVENWLMGTNTKTMLIDDNLQGYYYMAEVESVDFTDLITNGKLKVEFMAYPFKISTNYEGNNLWDSFCFETDVLQDNTFTINGTNAVEIYNRSAINISPILICSSDMVIVKDNITYNVASGTNKSYTFELKSGANTMQITGNGTIEFKFKSEVL